MIPVIATGCLLVFVVLGGIDGIVYHDRRYRLYAHRESRYEHWLHTARAFLFAPVMVLLVAGVHPGAGLVFVGVDMVVFGLDVVEESKSRRKWGGLSGGEYFCHVFATAFHYAAVALVFTMGVERPGYLVTLGWVLGALGLLAALDHVRVALVGKAALARNDGAR